MLISRSQIKTYHRKIEFTQGEFEILQLITKEFIHRVHVSGNKYWLGKKMELMKKIAEAM